MESDSPRLPTQQLGAGKYKILKRLAVGGMAEIFLAEAANIHGFRKKVVIKRMLPQYADEQVYIDMFLDEARLVARLNHPSVVQVFDIGEDKEGVFFTMEYVEGRDLSEILGTCYRADRLLSFSEVLAIAIPTAEGLHHAHEARDDHGELIHLIHRDVSPSNVIVTNAGRVKLLDFGVAKSKSQSRETTGVSLKGKFGYMAPEQCEGLAIDRRCDIYSFGVLLWELFTGKRLHGGGNEPQVLVKIMTEDPPAPSTKRPDIPPALDALVLKALARKRDDRYSTMQELLVELDRFMVQSGTVVSSRTLSTMLVDIFAEERPTIAMAIPTPTGPSSPSPSPSPQRRPMPLPAVLTPNPDAPTGVHTPSPSPHGRHPGPGSNSGHASPGANGGHASPGSNGGHASPGSNGGHQAPVAAQSSPGNQPIGATPQAYLPSQQTAPLPVPGGNTPSHGYATLSPGSQFSPASPFDQGSDIVVPMKSRKGIFIAIGGTVLLLMLALILTSGGEEEPKAGAEDESEVETEPAASPEAPTAEPKTSEEIAAEAKAAADKAAADQAATDKKAAADQAAADKAAADQAAADKKAAAAQAAADKKAASDKVAADKAATKLAAAQAAAAKKAAAAKTTTENKAAAAAAREAQKLAAAQRAAERKAAAAQKAADRKAAAAAREAKNPKDRKKKPPKWDPNSPFAPQ